MGFESSEYESMKQFYDQELKKTDPKQVIRMINMMFKDIRNPKLKKYFIDALSKHVSVDDLMSVENFRLQVSYESGLPSLQGE